MNTQVVVAVPAPIKFVVQDDQREADLAELCELTRPGGRIDVDAFDCVVPIPNPFELKTTSKGGVSTARDLGYKHLEKWSKRYWIIADFIKHAQGYTFTTIWFLAPEHMAEWFQTIRERLDRDRDVTERAVVAMIAGGLSNEDIERIRYLCSEGAKLNDPNIPKGYVRKHGIPVIENHAKNIRELVKQYPLT